MKVHMLERELARAQKDIVALRCQLACQRDCPPGSAATNPAVLRTAAVSAVGLSPLDRSGQCPLFLLPFGPVINLRYEQCSCTSLS